MIRYQYSIKIFLYLSVAIFINGLSRQSAQARSFCIIYSGPNGSCTHMRHETVMV